MVEHRETINERLNLSDHLSITHQRKGRYIGFAESARAGRAGHATVESDGTLTFGLEGPTSTGEHGTLETCRVLLAAWNAAGGDWSAPNLEDGRPHVDCTSTSKVRGKVEIQVVRAISDSSFWARLHRDGDVQRSGVSVGEIAAAMFRSIEMKASKIPADRRAEIVLVLNACDLSICACDDVVDHFLAQHAASVSGYGFASIWVVGPVQQLVHRLDEA